MVARPAAHGYVSLSLVVQIVEGLLHSLLSFSMLLLWCLGEGVRLKLQTPLSVADALIGAAGQRLAAELGAARVSNSPGLEDTMTCYWHAVASCSCGHSYTPT
jgi:hypothetical protein